ncbi:AtpZ/AtpI family protein [Desulfuribacillus alkaliarsenatis]|uniref:AtpZ/AtpI family protein n=1 Tax=Desulfuribacillus alkaliarsenatis TaxID=766136 RepID=UPI00159EFE4F|nr:AtpZ/AtpI family protein [Desulfuribacillus alkaliarsenatis]
MDKTPLKAIVLVTSIGIQFAAAIVIGVLIGSYLDGRFGTGQLFMVMGVFLGLAAGLLGAAKLIKPFLE